MLYNRRKILLALLEALGGDVTAIQMQKYLFLLTRKQEVKSFYFVPYRYGCYSFQANQDMATLATYNYLSIIDNTYHLRDKNANYLMSLDMFEQQNVLDVVAEYGGFSQNELLKYIYTHYPFFAINSSIAQEILSSDEWAKVQSQKRHKTESTLFTIGYEGVSLEQYINKLLIEDIRVLCDVRKNAYSQKYGFSKSQLQKACEGVGIQYIHVPSLGIESDKRHNLISQKDYDLLFEEYEKTTLQQNKEALEYVSETLRHFQRVALTCFEKNPMQCHRSRVAKAVIALTHNQYPLQHILF